MQEQCLLVVRLDHGEFFSIIRLFSRRLRPATAAPVRVLAGGIVAGFIHQ